MWMQSKNTRELQGAALVGSRSGRDFVRQDEPSLNTGSITLEQHHTLDSHDRVLGHESDVLKINLISVSSSGRGTRQSKPTSAALADAARAGQEQRRKKVTDK